MSRLPNGYAARIRPDLLRNSDGLLVGGSPLRALRLSPRAQSYVTGGRVLVRDGASAEIVARLIDGNLADPELPAFEVRLADLTVVVPVRDRPEQLDRCLAALAPLSCLVVDDASGDPASLAAVAGRHDATLVSLEENLGPAGARNAGLARVETRYVAFVDSDVDVGPDQLLGLARNFADERVALVGPRVRGVSRSQRPRWFERYDVAASSLDLGAVGARVQPGSAVAWLPAACLVGRTVVVRDQLGGFDESLRVGEDVDLVWRLVRAGAVVRYDPSHLAHHDTRSTVRGWLGRKFVYGTGGAALAERHGDWTAPAVLSATSAIGAAALLLRGRWSIPVAAAAVAINARELQRELPTRSVGTAVDVSVRGLGWAIRQQSALVLRHWWPLTAVALLGRPARRAVLSALLVDLAVASGDRRAPLIEGFLGRRLDDAAYGLGLWVGAARSRSTLALRPRSARSP